MPNSAWAQAVNPLQAAVEAMVAAHLASFKARRSNWTRLTDEDYRAIARAALPHMLRAVVERMTDHDLVRLFRAAGISIFPERQTCRTAILAALTDAAERLTDAAGRLP